MGARAGPAGPIGRAGAGPPSPAGQGDAWRQERRAGEPGRRRASGLPEAAQAVADPPGPHQRPRGRGGPAPGGGQPGRPPDRRGPPEGREVRQNHKDCSQVVLDVQRCARRFPPGMPEKQRRVLQEQLVGVILHVLRAHPELHYYQGYHDIAVTLLLVSGERMAIALLERLSTHHLRDFMDPTMDSTKHILNYLMPLLQQESPPLHDFMQRAEAGTIFALSWLITWFGHVLANFHHVLRLYDFFLASHPLMAVYFAAAVVLYREEEVLSCDCDMPSIHQLLSRLPQDLPYEALIVRAHRLFQRLPPTELAKQAAVQLCKSIAIGSFSAFQQAALHQRPDAILCQQQHRPSPGNAESNALLLPAGRSALLKTAVWGLTAVLGAAALAVTQSALEWGPDFLLQLF